jgi:uncharacterized protein involved in exopolysaccharide biosynthesis
LQEVLNNSIVAQLKADINRAEAQLQQLTTRLGDAHPQVVEARASLAELRTRLDAETVKVAGGVTVVANINRQRENEIRRSLEEQRAKVLRMKAVRDEGLVLLRDVENAQRAYDTLMQRFTQTSLESQATQSNVNLLTQASPPREPSSPRVLVNTLLSILIGTVLGLALALALELRNRLVRSASDVADALDLPVLGVMPKPGGKLQLGGNRQSAMQQRLMAPLPQPSKGA